MAVAESPDPAQDHMGPKTMDAVRRLAPVKHATLAEALAAFQGECPPVRKSSTANIQGKSRDGRAVSYKYDFADLSSIHEVIDPIKGRHGLSFSSVPTWRDGEFVLEYTLRHESGETIVGVWPLGDPMVNPQDMGKLITYYRRYAECAVLGVAPGGDDDGGANAPRERHAEQDWDRVLAEAEGIDNLPALSKLHRDTRLNTAPKEVQDMFAGIVAELRRHQQAQPEGHGNAD